jgi:hypothetical protein
MFTQSPARKLAERQDPNPFACNSAAAGRALRQIKPAGTPGI